MHRCLSCVLVLGLAGMTEAADTATVAVQSKAAPIVFAGEEIRAVLKNAGWSLDDDAAKAQLNIVLAEPDGQGEPESFAVAVRMEQAGRVQSVRVRGNDVRGVMYGGLDVAEQIALREGKARIEGRAAKPFLAVRGLKFNIPLAGNVYLSAEDQAHGEWFWDLEYWREFMRFLAYHRYNLLSFWNSHPFDQMVRIEKYPEANGLPADKLEANIAFFHQLFGMARDFGLDTSVVTWNIHMSAAFQKAHNVRDGQDSPLIRDYQRECVKALLKEYPELTGLGTCPGEAMGHTADWRQEWIRDTYFSGIAASGRENVPFILRYWGGTPAATANMLTQTKYPGPVYLDIKFNGEHMYSSVKPHLQDQDWLQQDPRPYKLLWHLRNDCIYQFRWGDPIFAAAVTRNCGGPDSVGFVMGSEIEVPGLDRVHTPQTAKHKTWKYEFEKNWMRFGVWGRAGYNPGEPQSYWMARFNQRFGRESGPAAFWALAAASKIIPLTTSFHWNYMNGDWYPEGNVGDWNTSAEMPFPNFRDKKLWHNVLEWTFNHVIDDTFQSIPEFVADQLSGVAVAGTVTTPPKYAEQVEAAALACANGRTMALHISAAGKDEWQCTQMDLRALEFLGRYYAAKARAATEVMFFLATGEEERRAAAIQHLGRALDFWRQLAAVADNHYAAHEIWLFGKEFDWKRYIPDAEQDIQIVRELAPWPRTEQGWTVGNAAQIRTARSWSLPPGSPGGLKDWLELFNSRAAATFQRDDQGVQTPEERTAHTRLVFTGAGTAILSLRSSAIESARINGQSVHVTGGSPGQSIVGPVRPGANDIDVTFAKGVSAPSIAAKTVVGDGSIFIEAESGALTAPMQAQDMPDVSGGKVIVPPKGQGRGATDAGEPVDHGRATYQVQIPADGEYVIHACVFWPDTSANSYFYAWDAAAPKMLGNDEAFNVWHWVSTPAEKLTAGAHTLVIRNRDEGAILDCLLIARDETKSAAAMLDAYYERLAAPHHFKPASLDEWKTRRLEARKLVLRDLGLDPMPEKLPLNITYGGQLDRGDYIVKRTYWQTWPDVYASGYLYLPKTPGKHPAMLSPHGHLSRGTRDPAEQTRSIVLAKKGYVSLAIDSVHLPPEGFLIGVSSLTAMTYNGIRGLDLLETLPEVDASRIGCCGMSGGGQQTAYLMAADDRLAVAVPVVLVSYFRRIMDPAGFPHCICNIIPGILRDVDMPELAATFAPKPAFYECVTGDWTRQFPKEEFPEIQSIYALYDAEANTKVQQWESGHDFNQRMREPAYAFINHYLKKVDDLAEAAEPEVKTESLETLATLDKPPAGAKPPETIIDWYQARYAAKAPAPKDAAGWSSLQRDVRRGLAEVLGDVPVRGQLAQAAEPFDFLGRKGRKLVVQTEPEIRVPVLLVTPDETRPVPVAILMNERGIAAVVDEYLTFVEALLKDGIAVAIAEVRLTGSLARNWSLDGVLFGRPDVGMAATDLRAIVDVLSEQPGLDTKRVVLVGLGDTGVSALCAGVLDERFSAVAVQTLGATYAGGRKNPLIANILRVADLPQLTAAIAPRGLLLGEARPDAYAITRQAYGALNAEPRLQTGAARLMPADIAAWVCGRSRSDGASCRQGGRDTPARRSCLRGCLARFQTQMSNCRSVSTTARGCSGRASYRPFRHPIGRYGARPLPELSDFAL